MCVCVFVHLSSCWFLFPSLPHWLLVLPNLQLPIGKSRYMYIVHDNIAAIKPYLNLTCTCICTYVVCTHAHTA